MVGDAVESGISGFWRSFFRTDQLLKRIVALKVLRREILQEAVVPVPTDWRSDCERRRTPGVGCGWT